MAALADYIDFAMSTPRTTVDAAIRKGMLRSEVGAWRMARPPSRRRDARDR